MNVLVQDLVKRITNNDPTVTQLAVSRLPLWTVSAAEIRALLEALRNNTHVTHLEVWMPPPDYDYSAVADHEVLIDDQDASYLEAVLAQNSTLQSLHFECNNQDAAWTTSVLRSLARGLQQNKSIDSLELQGEGMVLLENDSCSALVDFFRSCRLRELVLSHIQPATPEGLELLADSLAANQSLELIEFRRMEELPDSDEWNSAWTALVLSLGGIPTLKSLTLIEVHPPPLAMTVLGQSNSLQCLRWIESDVSVSALTALTSGFTRKLSLRTLDLRGNGLGKAHCQVLSKLLTRVSLEKLVLEENLIGDEGFVRLAAGLARVAKVNLRSNLVTGVGCQEFMRALATTDCTMQRLDLSENVIGNDGASAIGMFLQEKRCTLELLEVESCLLTDDGIGELARGLSKSRLIHLSLSQNQMGEWGAKHLVEMLAQNKSLQTLEVSSCHISDSTMDILAQGLSANATLQSLSAAFNAFGNDGLKAIGVVLPACNLERLELQFNDFNDEGLDALVQGLSQNYFLKDLFVLNATSYGKSTEGLVKKMAHALALNRGGRRALLQDSLVPALWPGILERSARLGGPDALFHMIQSRPDLPKRRDRL